MKRSIAFIERWIAKFNEVEIEVVSNICVAASILSFAGSAFLPLETSRNLIPGFYVTGLVKEGHFVKSPIFDVKTGCLGQYFINF